MENNLPMAYPPINGYTSLTNMLAILYGNTDIHIPWFYNHYVQLVSSKDPMMRLSGNFYDDININFIPIANSCPFIDVQRFNRRTIGLSSTVLTEFVEHQINLGYYVQFFLDQYFLSCSEYYQKEHLFHQTLVYGFDKEEKKIFITDFSYNNKFVMTSISYDELNESGRIPAIQDEKVEYGFSLLFKYCDNNYKFNTDLLLNNLKGYLDAVDSSYGFKFSYSHCDESKFSFGLKYYDSIIEYRPYNNELLELKAFHVLHCHKVLMELRLKYLLENNYLKESQTLEMQFKELTTETLVLKNMVNKFNFSKNENLLQNIYTKCYELKEKDKQATNNFYDSIHLNT